MSGERKKPMPRRAPRGSAPLLQHTVRHPRGRRGRGVVVVELSHTEFGATLKNQMPRRRQIPWPRRRPHRRRAIVPHTAYALLVFQRGPCPRGKSASDSTARLRAQDLTFARYRLPTDLPILTASLAVRRASDFVEESRRRQRYTQLRRVDEGNDLLKSYVTGLFKFFVALMCGPAFP